MHTRKLLSSFVVFGTLFLLRPACATLLSGTITGAVTSAGASVPGVMVGSLVGGSYSYDDAMTYNGTGGKVNAFTAFALTIGTNPHGMTLADLLTSGGIGGVVALYSTPVANDLIFFFKEAALMTYFGGGTVNGQGITDVIPQTYFVFNEDSARSFTFMFTASRGTVPSAVPEPTTLTLLGLGCLAALGGRRRKEHGPDLEGRTRRDAGAQRL